MDLIEFVETCKEYKSMKTSFSLGIIACGNMAQALLSGIIKASLIPNKSIYIFDTDSAKVDFVCSKYGINRASSNEELINKCDVVILAVKPNVCEAVLKPVGSLFKDKVLLSIVTGWGRARLEKLLDPSCRILRIMPNTPCLIGKGMCVFDLDTSLTNDDMEIARSIFESVGKVEMLPSSLMEAVTGVSGSGPAYVYIFIEAMADAGVLNGLPRDIAYKLAAQTVLGSAAMVLESGEHPAKLKDAVCSPGGTTIEAVYALEREGFRGAVIAAINDCTVKAKKLS